MDYEFSPEQDALRQAIIDTCAPFDDQYWMHKDIDGGFPHDFYQAIAKGGWLGIAIPEQYGGAGLGITEATIMMQAIAETGGAMSAASAMKYTPRNSTRSACVASAPRRASRNESPVMSANRMTSCFW